MKCARSLQLFGKDLRHYLYSRKGAWAILPGYATWVQGGCWLLAEALHQWIGPQAKLIGIHDGANILHHVVTAVQGCYLDADGASSKEGLLKRWEMKEGLVEPKLKSFRPHVARFFELECPLDSVRELVTGLQATFGPGDQVLEWAVS